MQSRYKALGLLNIRPTYVSSTLERDRLAQNTICQNCLNQQFFILHIFEPRLNWYYMSGCIDSAQSPWDIQLTDVRINKPMPVAITKPANCMTDCPEEVVARYSWIFGSIFAPWYWRSACLKADSLDMFDRRKRVACFRIMTTASRKVKYTLKEWLKWNTKD